jgi:hypothetical protein
MKHLTITTVGLAATILLGVGVSIQAEQPTRDNGRAVQYGPALDAYQHGYEHAYRDGADQGRQDLQAKKPYSWRNNDYWGARTYEQGFGDRNQYMEGYRAGYQAGYDDGYYALQGQYGQIYGRPQSGVRVPPANDPMRTASSAPPTWRSTPGIAKASRSASGSVAQRAINFRGNNVYKNGDPATAAYGSRDQCRAQFRDGIERGYADFGRSQYDGVAGNNRGYSPNGAANGGRTNDGRTIGTGGSSAGGTFSVPANRQWTPTGIRVNQGEVLRFTSTGEIRFSGNAADRAGVAGSPDHKFIGGAPIPNALAGALIGRIDNGLPFGIGDSTTITAPASGLLYLGTNDDNVNDNSGQFQVVISFGR